MLCSLRGSPHYTVEYFDGSGDKKSTEGILESSPEPVFTVPPLKKTKVAPPSDRGKSTVLTLFHSRLTGFFEGRSCCRHRSGLLVAPSLVRPSVNVTCRLWSKMPLLKFPPFIKVPVPYAVDVITFPIYW